MPNDPRHARVGNHCGGEHRIGRGTAARPTQQRLDPVEIGERVSRGRHQQSGHRHAEDQVAERQVPGLLQHLGLHLEAVAEQDQHQRDHREALHEVRGRVEVEHLEAALAEHESRHDEERRERQEAAPREARQQRADHQHRAEDGGRFLQKVDRGGDGRHARKLPCRGVRRALAFVAAAAAAFPAAAAAAPPRAQTLSVRLGGPQPGGRPRPRSARAAASRASRRTCRAAASRRRADRCRRRRRAGAP